MQTSPSTAEQINNLIEFRQAVYTGGLTKAQDAQMELVDSLLCNQRVNSFVELSLAPTFQRGWASAYAAIEDGEQNTTWLQKHLSRQPPRTDDQVFALDTTLWDARAPLCSYAAWVGVLSAQSRTGDQNRPRFAYSLLSWVRRRGSSWAPPIDTRRMQPDQTPVELGVAQVKTVYRERRRRSDDGLDVIVADGAFPLAGTQSVAIIGSSVRSRANHVPLLRGSGGIACSTVSQVHMIDADVHAFTVTALPSRSPRHGRNLTKTSPSLMNAGDVSAFAAGIHCKPNRMRRHHLLWSWPKCGVSATSAQILSG